VCSGEPCVYLLDAAQRASCVGRAAVNDSSLRSAATNLHFSSSHAEGRGRAL